MLVMLPVAALARISAYDNGRPSDMFLYFFAPVTSTRIFLCNTLPYGEMRP